MPAYVKGQTGNPVGRPKAPELKELRDCMREVNKTKRISLMKHFVNRAYEDDRVLIAVMKKILPDAKHVTVSADSGLALHVMSLTDVAQCLLEKDKKLKAKGKKSGLIKKS